MATFAPQPSEFEYPYWDTRVAYDTSLEAAINANESAAVDAQGDATQALADSATAQGDATQALADSATAQATADAALPVHAPLAVGTDLNTVTEVGVHPAPWTNGTPALNFPVAGTAGIVEVLTYGAVQNIQRFTPISGTASTRGTWTRRRSGADTWSAWTFQPTQRIDNTAGRAIYTWDETQNREQRIYGDSGRRDIQTLLHEDLALASAAPIFHMRREGNRVTLYARVSPKEGGGLVGKGRSSAFHVIPAIPQGFRTTGYMANGVGILGSQGIPVFFNSVGSPTILAAVGGSSNSGVWATADTLSAEVSWTTSDEWPTTLPGTAIGTIPFK